MPTIRIMQISDYNAVIDLMKCTPGITVRDADSFASTARYLQRNPGLSFVAELDGDIVGCLMAGHDGRRGYLQHLVVLPKYRQRGIARTLIANCLAALAKEGIEKSHLDVLNTNKSAAAFWEHQGWTLRSDIRRYSFIRHGGINA